jgi:nucleotide-binding universal stress UspA family protein
MRDRRVRAMRVLYATDGGQVARSAADLVGRIARPDNVEVTVLTVSDLKGIERHSAEKPAGSGVAKSRRRAAEVVEQATTRLAEEGITASGERAEGSPPVEIVRFLDKHPHDVVVVGAGNKTWIDRLLHGSVSTHLLHALPTSVLVVHETVPGAHVRMLIADDGSESARSAQRLIVELARPDACRATVIGVVTPFDYSVVPDFDMVSPDAMPIDPVEIGDLEAARVAAVRERVEKTAGALASARFSVDTKVIVGATAPEILDQADKGDYGLVVMGSRGLGGVGRTLLGSVSDAVSRHARAALVARHPHVGGEREPVAPSARAGR